MSKSQSEFLSSKKLCRALHSEGAYFLLQSSIDVAGMHFPQILCVYHRINVKIEAPYSQVVSVREDFSALSRGETGDWRRGENVIGFDFLFNHQLVTTLHFPNVRPNVCGENI